MICLPKLGNSEYGGQVQGKGKGYTITNYFRTPPQSSSQEKMILRSRIRLISYSHLLLSLQTLFRRLDTMINFMSQYLHAVYSLILSLMYILPQERLFVLILALGYHMIMTVHKQKPMLPFQGLCLLMYHQLLHILIIHLFYSIGGIVKFKFYKFYYTIL